MPRETKLTLVIMLLVMGTFGVIVWQKVSKDQSMVSELKRRAHELWAGTSSTRSDEPVAPPKIAKNDPHTPTTPPAVPPSKPHHPGQTTIVEHKPGHPPKDQKPDDKPWTKPVSNDKPAKTPKPTFANFDKTKNDFEPLNGPDNKPKTDQTVVENDHKPKPKPEVTFDLFDVPQKPANTPKGTDVAQAPPATNPWGQEDPFNTKPGNPHEKPKQKPVEDPFGDNPFDHKPNKPTVAQNDPPKDLLDFFNTPPKKPNTQQTSFQEPGSQQHQHPNKPGGGGFQADPFGTPQFEDPHKHKPKPQTPVAQTPVQNDPFAFPLPNETGPSQSPQNHNHPSQQTNAFPGSMPSNQSPHQQPGSSLPPGFAHQNHNTPQQQQPNTFDQFPQINNPNTQFDYNPGNQTADNNPNFNYGNGQQNQTPPPQSSGLVDVYEVGPADTYWNISSMAYGSSRYFQALAEYNRHRIPNPKKLKAGMKVLLPDAEELDRLYPKLTGFNERAMQDPNLRQVGLFRDEKGNVYYRVAEEDSLSTIAESHLGRASRWIEIFQLNRAILKSPEKIKVDMVLRMPADSSNLKVLP